MKNTFEKNSEKFASEKEMALKFGEFLFTNLRSDTTECLEEVKGLFGVPDYLVVEKNLESISCIISFELKLKDWRKGLRQAFKYKSFSNLTILVVDHANIELALNNLEQFIHFNIGLASFDTWNHLRIHYLPTISEPFSPYLIRKVNEQIFTDDLSPTDSISEICIEKSWERSILNQKISTYSV